MPTAAVNPLFIWQQAPVVQHRLLCAMRANFQTIAFAGQSHQASENTKWILSLCKWMEPQGTGCRSLILLFSRLLVFSFNSPGQLNHKTPQFFCISIFVLSLSNFSRTLGLLYQRVFKITLLHTVPSPIGLLTFAIWDFLTIEQKEDPSAYGFGSDLKITCSPQLHPASWSIVL